MATYQEKLALIDAAKERRVKEGLGVPPTPTPREKQIPILRGMERDSTLGRLTDFGNTAPVFRTNNDAVEKTKTEDKLDEAKIYEAMNPKTSTTELPDKPAQMDKIDAQRGVESRDIYTELAKLTDEQFKKFVDVHNDIDRPAVPGTGYVELGLGKNPTPEERARAGRIQRIIQNPNLRPEGGYPKIGIEQYKAQTERERNLIDKTQAGETRKLNYESQDEARKATAKDRSEAAFSKKLFALSPTTQNNAGEQVPNWKIGLLDMIDSGQKPENMHGFEDIAPGIIKERDKWVAKQLTLPIPKDKKGKSIISKIVVEDLNKPGTETYKYKMDLLEAYKNMALNPEPRK